MANPWDNDPIIGEALAPGPIMGVPLRPKPEPVPSGYRMVNGVLEPIPGGPADPNAKPNEPPSGYRWGANGQLVAIPGGPADKETNPPKDPKVTEGERAAAGYYLRALNAHKEYGAGVLPRGAVAQTLVDMLPNAVENTIASPERREAQNYADEFIRAKLRKESGAAIPSDEMAREYRVYFPVPGDTAADLERKAALREQAIEALKIGAGSEAEGADALLNKDVGEAPASPPPPVGEHIFEGGSQQGVELSDGGTQRVDDPVLAGVNAQINGMLKAGNSGTEIANYLKQSGIPLNAVNLREVLQWRKQNPDYKGDYTVDIDDKLVPMSGMRSLVADAANSPISAGVVAAADTLTGGHLDNIVGGVGGNAEIANMGIGMLREANPVASFTGDLTGGGLLYGAGAMGIAGRGAAPATVGAFAPRAVAADAAMGGYVGSGQGGTQMFSPGNALAGAVGGAGGGILGRGAINTAGRTLSPTGGQLAPAYAEGVQPTIGQRMGGVASRAEQAFASVPGVGGIQRSARNKAVGQWQVGAFNKALREIDGIGGVKGQLPEGTGPGIPAHKYMQESFNKAYDDARSGLTFRQDPDFLNDFNAIRTEVAALPDEAQRIFNNFVNDGTNRMNARGGVLSGRDYQALVSRIESKIRRTRKNPSGDTELADALEGLVIAMDKGARRHSAPEAVAKIDAADRGYVMAVLIEGAGRRSGSDVGEFTGKQLEREILNNSGRRSRRALRGEAPLQDYAKAGVRLGDNVPDSGTGERIATMGGMGAVAHFVDPVMLTPWAIDTLANLPGGKQAANLLLAPNRKALDPARRYLMERAKLGGLLAAPAAQATAQ